MEWNTWRIPDSPPRGSLRYRNKFAIIPRKCNDDKTRWLTTVAVREVYCGTTMSGQVWAALDYYAPVPIGESCKILPKRHNPTGFWND